MAADLGDAARALREIADRDVVRRLG